MKLTINGVELNSEGPVTCEYTQIQKVPPYVGHIESFEDFTKRAELAARRAYGFNYTVFIYDTKRGIKSKHSGRFRPLSIKSQNKIPG